MTAPDIEPFQHYLETLTPQTVTGLGALVAHDVRFIDPFHDVRGAAVMEKVFAAIFISLTNVRFTVADRAWSGSAWYLRWRFEGERRQGGQIIAFDGMSEIHFDHDGKVRYYRDHWDAAQGLYERFPLIGFILRWLRRRIAGPMELRRA